MKKSLLRGLVLAVALGIAASGVNAKKKTEPDPFWLGADISGTTLNESLGKYTMNADSVRVETTQLMNYYGMNAIRLRVWVNPEGGFSSADDVLKMALRAKNLGMPVMIDFHYSDSWADPGKQPIPEAWKGMNLKKMKKALAKHTKETLKLLKKNDIDVRWVQIGNETTHGFLWPIGRFEDNPKNYAELTKEGIKAARDVYPKAKMIIHLDNGFDKELYTRVFDSLKKNKVKWDLIGMSIYPYWAIEGGKEKSDIMTLTDAISNIRMLKARYGTDVMVVETGVDARNPESGAEFIRALIKSCREFTDGACAGVFYWAPECNAEEAYRLGAFSKGRPTVIMDAFMEAATQQAAELDSKQAEEEK